MRAIDLVRSYAAHPDPLVASANFIALLVASNQPFYPLYVYWLATTNIEPVWYTFLSTPFFLAVPALSRWNTVAGRALLPLAGIGNTILCAQLFGVQSAVEIFLIPCAVLAILLFRPAERTIGFAIAGIADQVRQVPRRGRCAGGAVAAERRQRDFSPQEAARPPCARDTGVDCRCAGGK